MLLLNVPAAHMEQPLEEGWMRIVLKVPTGQGEQPSEVVAPVAVAYMPAEQPEHRGVIWTEAYEPARHKLQPCDVLSCMTLL